jgi:hypothetical protein
MQELDRAEDARLDAVLNSEAKARRVREAVAAFKLKHPADIVDLPMPTPE